MKVETILPDGQLAHSNTWRDSLGAYDTDGSISTGYMRVNFFRDDSKLTIGTYDLFYNRVEEDGEEIQYGNKFNVNQLSDDFQISTFGYMEMSSSGEKVWAYNTVAAKDIAAETVLTNKAEDYMAFDAEYGEFADVPQKYTESTPYRWGFFFMRNNNVMDACGSTLTQLDGKSKSYVSVNKGEDTDVELLFRHGQVSVVEVDPYSGGLLFYPVISPVVTFSEDGARYNHYISDDQFIDSEAMRPEGGVDFRFLNPFSSHPRFSWDYNPDEMPVFGNSVPVMVTVTEWQPGLYPYSCLYPYYFGRMSELREADNFAAWAEVDVDGENIFQGTPNELKSWSLDEFSLPKASGNYTFLFENDCATVDGMPSMNRTVMKVNASGPDREAPTLTMLNFRNAEDKITDKFENAADCTLEFSAADLSSQMNEFNCDWFRCESPAAVKVECAAEGSENFKELTVHEVPELFTTPAFGSFYRVSFADVDTRSESGWFQIRVTVTDAVGNSQQQTLTPALYIGSLASVDAVDIEEGITIGDGVIRAEGEITVYDIAGKLVRSGEDELSIDGLSGAYIVRCGSKSKKVII